VPAEEGYLLRDAALLIEGDDGEGAPAAGFPVDGEVFRVRLCNVSACSASASSGANGP
jgi:hypothetical protein